MARRRIYRRRTRRRPGEFGLEGGVAALQKIAGLNAISRVIPVTVALQLVPAN